MRQFAAWITSKGLANFAYDTLGVGCRTWTSSVVRVLQKDRFVGGQSRRQLEDFAVSLQRETEPVLKPDGTAETDEHGNPKHVNKHVVPNENPMFYKLTKTEDKDGKKFKIDIQYYDTE